MLSTAPRDKIHFRITYQNKGPINLYNLLFLYTFYTLTLDLLTTVIKKFHYFSQNKRSVLLHPFV